MSTKQFKDIEAFIKQSAESNEPLFDETAWKQMEDLLNKEKNRKKPVPWLPWLFSLMLILAAGGYFLLEKDSKKSNSSKNSTANKKVNRLKDLKENNSLLPHPKSTLPISDKNIIIKDLPVKDSAPVLMVLTAAGDAVKKPTVFLHSTELHQADLSKNNQANKSSISKEAGSKTSIKIQAAASETEEAYLQPAGINYSTTSKISAEPALVVSSGKPGIIKPLDTSVVVNKSNTIKPDNSARKQKDKNNGKPGFYLTGSVGAEANGIKFAPRQRSSFKVGIGAGYSFNKKISIQAGFYSSAKKYIAGPSDYKIKPGTYWGTLDISKIDANCRVYEIPLLLRYDFTPDKKIRFYSVAGLSSYLMKKEDYQYTYKRYGYTQQGSATFTGNQHLLSVAKFSAGVEKNISKTVSINVAPAFSIPLRGVGEGKVKLYSSEILAGIRYQPFKKINNK